MKNSFSLLELIFAIFLLILISSYFYFNPTNNKLQEATKRIELYLKQTRYQALIDNKKNFSDTQWHKQRWTMKFFRCSNNRGLYYVIYSDTNKLGHPNEDESLLDPLTKKRVYATNSCEYNSKRSKYVLLTKEFDIIKVDISCNTTDSLGQISFGSDGKVYTKLSTKDNGFNEFELKKRCEIKLIDKNLKEKSIFIEPKSGFIGLNKLNQ